MVGLIEEYSLSGECLERLDLGLNNGWVSFRARFRKLFFLFRFHRKKNPKKLLTGAERVRKFRAAHHTTADLRNLADQKNYNAQTPSSPYQSLRRPMREPSATKNLRRLTSAAEKIYFLR